MPQDSLSLLHAGVGVGMRLPLLYNSLPRFPGRAPASWKLSQVQSVALAPLPQPPPGHWDSSQHGNSVPRAAPHEVGRSVPQPWPHPGTLVGQKSWTDRQTDGSRDAESLSGQVGKVLHLFWVLMGHWPWGKQAGLVRGGGRGRLSFQTSTALRPPS